jgi:hypothetical protein
MIATGPGDHYEAYYADMLWNLLPAVYREADGEPTGGPGPLQELVNRIGVQAAVLRRGIDRMWEDQAIETADDWVVPYLADLLATNLVSGMGPRERRLDVAKTIYYRRRKGTLDILEEIANDITGWDARVVEFFHRLARTRHGLDPAIGRPADTDQPDANRKLQAAQGLVGPTTGTAIGGFADLRNAYGASRAHTAFDEYFHTADTRRGAGTTGWYGIPRLGVFLWRLRNFGVARSTPVAVKNCDGHYTFDPTGRYLPLFVKASRAPSSYGDYWVPPDEWQLPGPIDTPLFRAHASDLYPASLAVHQLAGGVLNEVPLSQLTIYPRLGRFRVGAALRGQTLAVSYHYGLPARIGAGPYDRRAAQPGFPAAAPVPVTSITGGGTHLATALAGLTHGTVRLGDSLTYDTISDLTGLQRVRIDSENTIAFTRPCIRPPAPAGEWTFTGAAGAVLELDGLLISGTDVVLDGSFDHVRISCSSFDPGRSGLGDTPPTVLTSAADGRNLTPARLWVQGRVRRLEVDRCVLGPVRTRAGGHIEALTMSDSIIHATRTTDPSTGKPADPALSLSDGTATLERCTVLGPAALHRLAATECIFDDVVIVGDAQHGCVRFSAWATGSVLPRQYECVEIPPTAPIFTTRVFGQPGYCQLLATADRAIRSSISARPSLVEGGPAGSEMGVFAGEQNAIRQRSLRIKLQEFMPLGLDPVIIPVT